MRYLGEASLKKPAKSKHLLHYTEEKSCEEQGFWLEMARDRLTPQQKSEAHDIAVACYADANKP